MFRRRRDTRPGDPPPADGGWDGEETDVETDVETEVGSHVADTDAESTSSAATGPAGPWDAEQAPDDDLQRLDLGGLRVPVPAGMELRVEATEEQILAVSLVDGPAALQLSAFAAPRSEGLWAEVRAEIAQSLRGSGGSAEEAEGPFGPELRAQIPGQPGQPGQPGGAQPARFLGADGPRWFLRGVITGAALSDPQRAHRLEDAFRRVVVVRGTEAMAPRDPLPLRLPREVTGEMAAAPPDDNPFRQL